MISPTPHSLFRKKPVVVEAMLYTADNCRAIHAWAGLGEHGESSRGPGYYCGTTPLYIETLEGTMQADPGDWIIKGVKGEFYPCKPDIFAATYEPAGEVVSEKGPMFHCLAGIVQPCAWPDCECQVKAGQNAAPQPVTSPDEISRVPSEPAVAAFSHDKWETPRTDAWVWLEETGTEVIRADNARQLERELADVTDRLAGYERHVAVLEGMQETREEEDLSARRDITDEAIIAAFSNGGGVDEIPTHQPHAPLLTNTQIVWVVRRFIAGLCSIPFTRNDVLEEAANVCEQMRPSSTSPDLNVQCQTLDNAARLIRALKS